MIVVREATSCFGKSGLQATCKCAKARAFMPGGGPAGAVRQGPATRSLEKGRS